MVKTICFRIDTGLCAKCRLCHEVLSEFLDDDGNIIRQPQTDEEKDVLLSIFQECPNNALEIV